MTIIEYRLKSTVAGCEQSWQALPGRQSRQCSLLWIARIGSEIPDYEFRIVDIDCTSIRVMIECDCSQADTCPQGKTGAAGHCFILTTVDQDLNVSDRWYFTRGVRRLNNGFVAMEHEQSHSDENKS